MMAIKGLARNLLDALRVAAGWIGFLISGRTPAAAYQAMIRLFCATGGRSNDWMSRAISVLRPPYALPEPDGVLGALSRNDLGRVVADLRTKGYYVFSRRLPDEVCDQLTAYALGHEAEVRVTDEQASARGRTPKRAIYDPSRPPEGVRYDFSQQQVMDIPEVQDLLSDLSIIAVAQSYLGAQPVADVMCLWWSTAFSATPDKEAAQFFHFDMDRVKWLKFFFYLTDVGPQNGPHTFVAGSHRSGSVANALLSKGYSRLGDDEVALHFPPESFIEFTAPRGTILAEDTRGLHKGKLIASGHRLVLQLQFSNSLFGTTYEPIRFSKFPDRQLLELAQHFPRLYSNLMPSGDATR